MSDICPVCGQEMTANCNGANCDTQTVADEIIGIDAATRAIIEVNKQLKEELKDEPK